MMSAYDVYILRTLLLTSPLLETILSETTYFSFARIRAAGTCYSIGPWDCDIGTPLTVEQCCNLIKASVPEADERGNHIDCYVDPPIGSASNPVDPGRVCIHVDANDFVVRPPRNE